jgi:hypothetical protein
VPVLVQLYSCSRLYGTVRPVVATSTRTGLPSSTGSVAHSTAHGPLERPAAAASLAEMFDSGRLPAFYFIIGPSCFQSESFRVKA